jgi:hypothetical protein
MTIKRIEFVHEITNPSIDNIAVFVKNKDGYTYTVVVATGSLFADKLLRLALV